MLSRDEIMAKVQDIFRDKFDDDTLSIIDKTSAADIEDWDSLEQVSLVVAMETEFEIKFNIREVSELKNVGNMVDLITEKVSAKQKGVFR